MGAQAVRLSNVDIDNALRDKDFEVLFQPILDLGNGALARVETFIRWRHPSLGVLPPGAFISFFETQGRMSELTRYVLSEALSAYQGWRGPYAPGFSINLALSDLSDESFPSHFTVLLRESGFPAELVTLECPMPAVDADIAATARQLQRLAETGARLAIEVRGRANDFLKSVRPFPFDEIKTGGAAILRFARTVRGPGLSAISELLELAAEQNAAITAVGVEDQASLSALRGLGFAAAQGNHLAKVGPLAQFMPSHVNDVRALLGLDPLSSDDLAALFRTGGPKLTASAIHPETEEIAPEPEAVHTPAPPIARADHEDELVERLAARIARADPASSNAADAAEETARARAAAIARARRKSLARERLASRNALRARAEALAETDVAPPREMQERLSREFEAFTDQPTTAADEFEIADAATPAQTAAATEPEGLPAMEGLMQDEADSSAPGERSAHAQPAHSQTDDPAMPNETRMAVPNATAHFTPTIRVSGPEPRGLQDHGDLHRVEAFEPMEDLAPQDPAPITADEPEPADIGAELVEDEIPAVRAGAQWVEETVAIKTPEEPAAKKKKSFLNRTVIPLSALRITHFWPRAIRKRMKRASTAKQAKAAE